MSLSAELQTSILLLLNGGQEMNMLYVFGFNSLHPYDHIDFLPINEAIYILVISYFYHWTPWKECFAVNPPITDTRLQDFLLKTLVLRLDRSCHEIW